MPNISVSPSNPRSTHDISLSDGVLTFGAMLDGGPAGIQELPQTPSTLLINKQGGKFGDYDPSFSHLEQSDWTGGRGQESFVDDPTRFLDNYNAWTLTPGRLLSGLQWRKAETMTQKTFALPGNMTWYPLIGVSSGNRYRARSFTDSGGTVAEQVYMWIRRRGAPGTLTVEICNNNAGVPGTVRVTATLTASSVTDVISVFPAFDWAGSNTLTNGVLYWVKIYGAATDNAASHWEVGGDPTGVASGSGKVSSDNSAWSDTTIGLYFWVSTISSATVAINGHYPRDWKLFFLQGATYAVSRYRPPFTLTSSNAVSTLYINGDRGTVSSSASQTTVTDSSKAWTTNQWAGAKVKIVSGPGDGEWRSIVSNTATALTITPAFSVTQTTATRYVIYDTPTWTIIGSNPATMTVTDVVVANGIAYLSCGGVRTIVQFRANLTTSAHEFSTASAKYGTLLAALNHPDDGMQIFAATPGGTAIYRWKDGDDGFVAGSAETGFAIDNTADKTKLNTAALPLKAWTTNQWANCIVTIFAGPGVTEQRTVSSNTATVLTVSSAFTVTHTAATQYSISGETNKLYSSPTPAKAWSPNQWAGSVVKITSGPGINESKTISSNTATVLAISSTWTATLTDDSQYEIEAWGVTAAPVIRTQVGDGSYNITNLVTYNNEMYVFKEDSLWRVVNDRAMQVPVGLEAMPSPSNGVAAVAQNLFLYFSWSHSAERLYGGTLDDFGPWKGRGLPAGRQGPISAMESVMAWLFVAIDGGPDGTSCVMVWNGMGWSEVFRAWGVGWRIRQIKWVPQIGGRPKLYISVGPLLVFIHMPLDTLNPENDTTLPYMHESALTTSTFDMGARRLPKMWKEFEAFTESLKRTSSAVLGRSIDLDYQLDDAIGGSVWTYAGQLDNSPVDTLQIMRGNKRAIRFRLRMHIQTSTSPMIVKAYILEGYARTPVKYQYNLRIKLSTLQRTYSGQPDTDPDVFLNWLKEKAGGADKITVNSIFPQWHNRLVVIEPPSVARSFVNRILNMWGGTMMVTIRDA
jgi:hypothetical protein